MGQNLPYPLHDYERLDLSIGPEKLPHVGLALLPLQVSELRHGNLGSMNGLCWFGHSVIHLDNGEPKTGQSLHP
jgi:hypothetical protein